MGDLGEYWRDVKEHYSQIKFTKKEKMRMRKNLEESQNLEKKLMEMLADNEIKVEKFANGQLFLGGVIDWWTTTGTAIVRKTKERYYFTHKKPLEIVETVLKYK